MNPGTSTLSQINKVLEVTWKPREENIASINRKLVETMLENVVVNKKYVKALYPKITEDEMDLL